MAFHPHLRTGFLVVLAFALAEVGNDPAHAQSGTQTTVNGTQTVISKDVGGERWAITFSPKDGTVTGNVFLTDGSEPKFVWCERVSDNGVLDPENVQINFRCYGADRCISSPCTDEGWQFIADVTLPGSFFLPSRDPFSPLQPRDAFCDPLAYGSRPIGGEPSFDVDTAGCNYVTVSQPSIAAVQPGDEVFIRFWHFALDAPSPGVAYVAIQLGDTILWSAEFPIPSPSGLVTPLITSQISAPVGTPVYFHVQNHGANSYNIIDVKVRGENGTQIVNPDAWTLVSDGVPTTRN